jgi:hypothetical protein
MKKDEIKIGERMYSRWWLSTPKGQHTLAYAHAKEMDVTCLCRPSGVAMHVAHAKTYFLRRNPGSGHLHATSCPAYDKDEPTPAISAANVTEPKFSKPVERDSIGVQIIPAFSLGEHSKDGLPLDDLLRLLWREARLNVWAANKDKRDWATIQSCLEARASRISIRGAGLLSDHLLIPKPFVVERADELKHSRLEWLKLHVGTILVGGIVREHAPTHKNNLRILIKHLPEFPLITKSEYAAEIAACEHQGNAFVFVLAVAKFNGDYFYAEECAFISISKDEALPLSEIGDGLLVDYLRREKRNFLKPIGSCGTELSGMYLTDCKDGVRVCLSEPAFSDHQVVLLSQTDIQAGVAKLPPKFSLEAIPVNSNV